MARARPAASRLPRPRSSKQEQIRRTRHEYKDSADRWQFRFFPAPRVHSAGRFVPGRSRWRRAGRRAPSSVEPTQWRDRVAPASGKLWPTPWELLRCQPHPPPAIDGRRACAPSRCALRLPPARVRTAEQTPAPGSGAPALRAGGGRQQLRNTNCRKTPGHLRR